MKVVHPGKSDQAVGWKPVSADQELARMNIHNNARLTPQGRLLLVQRVTDQGWTVRSAAEAAGLSQRQTDRWLKRYRAGGAAALADRSSAPQRCPHGVPAERIAEIERVRRQRLSGPAIARQLGMPASTVGGILRRLGRGKLAALETRPPVVRYQRAQRASCSTSTSKSSGASRPSGIASPAIGATPAPAPAGNTCTCASTTPRAWPTARCCRTSARTTRCRSSSARSAGSRTRV
jgi:transposase-like protein